MRKTSPFPFILFTSLLTACGVKDPNKSIEKVKKPVVDTVNTVSGAEAKLIDNYLNTLAADSGFSGGIFISRNDTLLLCKGYGQANRAAGTAFTPYTLACMGSITKNFTATAILHLYAEGKLLLTDPLSKFFPEAPADKKKITIHQLLTHSSGFHEFLQNDGGDYEKLETGAFLERAFKEPLAFKPGTKAVYTNVGMSVLGVIIEKVSGKSYEDYLSATLFTPAGVDIGYYAHEQDSSLLAIGYQGEQYWGTLMQRYARAGGGPYWNLKANGGLYASVKDMHRWNQQLHTLLPDSLIDLMYTSHMTEDGTGGLFSFGYGCNLSQTKRGTLMIDNGGSNGIYFARLIRLPQEGVVMYMVTNNSAVNTNMVLPNVSQLFFEGHISMNAMAHLDRFESKGAEVLYKLMMEKGEKYFGQHAFEALEKEGLSTSDDMFFLEAGQKLISEQKFPAALALYTLYTREFPGIVVAWNDLGEIYLEMKETAKAKSCFEQALKLRPENQRAIHMLEKIKAL